MNNCRAFIVVGTVAALTSLQAATLADADALYRQKKWIPAAKAYDPIAKQALFCRLMLAIWTKQWDEAGALRDEFMRRYPASDNGEWTAADGALAPVCYRINQPVTIKAKFKTHSSLLTSARISAENASGDSGEPHCFQTFGAQTVSFSNGQTGDILFTMQGTAPSSISLLEQEHLVWKASRINDDTKAAEVSITNSGPHKVYVILGNPVEPWSNAGGDDNNQNAWTNALEFVLSKVEGKDSVQSSLAEITRSFFADMGFSYDIVRGTPRYYSNMVFYVSRYMQRDKFLVNCYDQALAVAMFGRLIGIAADAVFAQPFGYINKTHIVGIDGECNNPFFGNNCYTNLKCCAEDDISRSRFGNHMYVLLDGYAYDACAGPALGVLSHEAYLHSVIDTSTLAELSKSVFTTNSVISVFPHNGLNLQ